MSPSACWALAVESAPASLDRVPRQRIGIDPRLGGWMRAHREADADPSRRRPHRHEALEANLITGGHGAYLIGERRYRLQRGSVLFLFPDQEHLLLESSRDFTMWIAVFDRRLARELSAAAPLLRARDPGGVMLRSVDQSAYRALDAVAADIAQAEGDPLRCTAGLRWWALACWRACERADDEPGISLHPSVARAVFALQRDAGCDLPALAERTGLSASRLSRLFAEQIGQSVTAFRNRVRVERFLEHYGDGHRRTMLDAALEAGFGSYAQFNRVFHAQMGMSAAEYRRRYLR